MCIYQWNIDILWIESLNSDGQQFHQYQQNEQSPLTLRQWTQKKTMTYDIGNPGSGLRQEQTTQCRYKHVQLNKTCTNLLALFL